MVNKLDVGENFAVLTTNADVRSVCGSQPSSCFCGTLFYQTCLASCSALVRKLWSWQYCCCYLVLVLW